MWSNATYSALRCCVFGLAHILYAGVLLAAFTGWAGLGWAGLGWAGPNTAGQAADIDAFARRALALVGTVPGLSFAVVDGHLMVRCGVMSAVAEAATDAESIRAELVPFQRQIITFGADTLTFAGQVFARQ